MADQTSVAPINGPGEPQSKDDTTGGPVLSVRDLRTYFFTRRGEGKAVDGVSFDLYEGETLGLVGESGSGKSMTALSILGLNPKPESRIVGGEVSLAGESLPVESTDAMRRYRGKQIAIILQDPMTALNPVLTMENQIAEPIKLHHDLPRKRIRDRVLELLHLLRIPDAERRLSSYPHQFSGGMRQRLVGAIALSCDPVVLIADEPTTSLDVTLQAAYLALLKDIQTQQNVSIIFITHDFGIVAKLCHRVAVMYAGKIIETSETVELFDRPAHPYTMGLLASIPDVDADMERLDSIPGSPPSLYERSPGCDFASRCAYATDICRSEPPPVVVLTEGHSARCWHAPDLYKSSD